MQPFFRKPEKLDGFTLIELMIVIALVAIMASFVVPSFFRAAVRFKTRAHVVNIQNSLQQARTLATAKGNVLLRFSDVTGITGFLDINADKAYTAGVDTLLFQVDRSDPSITYAVMNLGAIADSVEFTKLGYPVTSGWMVIHGSSDAVDVWYRICIRGSGEIKSRPFNTQLLAQTTACAAF